MHSRCSNGTITLSGTWTGQGFALHGRRSRWLLGAPMVEHYAPFSVSRAVEWHVLVGGAAR